MTDDEEHTDFAGAFGGASFVDRARTWSTRVVRIGELTITRNNAGPDLSIEDVDSEREDSPPGHPLSIKLPEGEAPVELCIAQDTADPAADEAVAAARIRFAPPGHVARATAMPAATWRPLEALYESGVLPVHEHRGHTVDSGLTTLIAAATLVPPPGAGEAPVLETVGRGVQVRRRPPPTRAITFTAGSGGGDAHYPTWGLVDESGAAHEIAVDFLVLTAEHWEAVDIPLPFTSAGVQEAVFDALGVKPVVEGPSVLRIQGDVARIWFGRLYDDKRRGVLNDKNAVIASRPAGRSRAEFSQTFDVSRRPPEATHLRLKVFRGRRALPRV